MFPRDPNAYDPTNDIYSDDLFEAPNAKFIQTFIAKLNASGSETMQREMEGLTPAQRRAHILPPQKRINALIQGNTCELVACGNTNIGLCEVMGMRPSQEDATAFALLDAYQALEPDKQTRVIQQTFAAMQAEAVQQDADSYGSTMSMCVAWMTKSNREGVRNLNIQLGYVGDSPVYLVRADTANLNNHIECIKLTKHDHHVSRMNGLYNERAGRYEYPDGFPMTHAIGDIISEKFGVSHQPALYQQTFEVQPNERTFIVMGCDGLFEDLHNITESEQLTLKYEIGKMLDLPLHEMAKQLVKRSAIDGTKDNITCMMVEPSESCVATCVADGHGASHMSRYIGEQFEAVAKNVLESVRALQKSQHGFLRESVNIVNALMQPAVRSTFSNVEKECLQAVLNALTAQIVTEVQPFASTEQRLTAANELAKQKLATKTGLFGKPSIRNEALQAFFSSLASVNLNAPETAMLARYIDTWFRPTSQPVGKTG